LVASGFFLPFSNVSLGGQTELPTFPPFHPFPKLQNVQQHSTWSSYSAFCFKMGSLQTPAEEDHPGVPSFPVPYRGSRRMRTQEKQALHARQGIELNQSRKTCITSFDWGLALIAASHHEWTDQIVNTIISPTTITAPTEPFVIKLHCPPLLLTTKVPGCLDAKIGALRWKFGHLGNKTFGYVGNRRVTEALTRPSWRKKGGGKGQRSLQRLFKPAINIIHTLR